MADFTMPSLGADMDEGILQEWLVGPGDRVSRGDVVAVVETDKAAIEVECFESGTVGRLLVEAGTRVPVGTPLAVIESGTPAVVPDASRAEGVPEPVARTAAEATPDAASATAAGPKPETVTGPALTVAAPVEPRRKPLAASPTVVEAGPLVRHLAAQKGIDLTAVHGTGRGGRITRADVEHADAAAGPRVRATPYARRLALELGVELRALPGSGTDGAIRAADVHDAARAQNGVAPQEEPATARERPEEPAPAPAPSSARHQDQRADAMRQAIGGLMSRSKKEIPHYYLSTTIDLAATVDWLHRRNRGRPPADRLVPAALLLKAAAVAGREVPQLNGFWEDGAFTPGTAVHLGVAVSLRDGGLITPVIHDADALKSEELMAALKDLVQRARRGRLRGSELTGATLTVTNLGDQGVEAVFGVIHPPQVALVGFGAVVERPWATGGLLGVCPVVTATLSADHRASDGAIGARYLTAVGRLLQNPEEL